MRDECLGGSGRGEGWIGPGGCAVAVDEGVVAVPRWGAVEGFGGVVPAFAVAAHDEDFVGGVRRSFEVQREYLASKALPLG